MSIMTTRDIVEMSRDIPKETIELAARAVCRHRGTGQCAAICLSHSSCHTTKGQCPEVLTVWREDIRAALEVTIPLIEAKILQEAAEDIDVLTAEQEKRVTNWLRSQAKAIK